MAAHGDPRKRDATAGGKRTGCLVGAAGQHNRQVPEAGISGLEFPFNHIRHRHRLQGGPPARCRRPAHGHAVRLEHQAVSGHGMGPADPLQQIVVGKELTVEAQGDQASGQTVVDHLPFGQGGLPIGHGGVEFDAFGPRLQAGRQDGSQGFGIVAPANRRRRRRTNGLTEPAADAQRLHNN